MKKRILTAMIAFFAVAINATAQETTIKRSKFDFNAYTMYGSATLEQSNFVNLHGNSISNLMSLGYNFNDNLNLSLGYESIIFKANGAVAGETFSLRYNLYRIPLNLTYKINVVEDKINVLGGIGLYANNFYKQKVGILNNESTDKNLGWNMGLNARIGVEYEFYKNFHLGLGIQSSNDLTKAEYKGNKTKLMENSGFYLNIGFNIN